MDNLRQIAQLHILRGATTVGATLTQEEIDRIIGRVPVGVRNPIGWFFVVGRNAGVDKIRHERSEARKALQAQEAAIRQEKELEEAEVTAHQANKLLDLIKESEGLVGPRAFGLLIGVKMIHADLRGAVEEYNALCAGELEDNIYQRRCRALVFLKTMLLDSEFSVLKDLVAGHK